MYLSSRFWLPCEVVSLRSFSFNDYSYLLFYSTYFSIFSQKLLLVSVVTVYDNLLVLFTYKPDNRKTSKSRSTSYSLCLDNVHLQICRLFQNKHVTGDNGTKISFCRFSVF